MNRWITVAALAAVLSACRDAGETPPPAPGSEASTDSAEAPSGPIYSAPGSLPPPKDTSLKAGEVGGAELSLNVGVDVTETSLKISHSLVAAGQVTFALQNKGTQPHALEIVVAHGGRWRTLPAPPGGSSTVTMVLGHGNYEAYCPLKHGAKIHRESGARTQFVVK